MDRKESIGQLHKVFDWTEDRLAVLPHQSGLDPVPMVEESPHLVLVFTTLELMGTDNPSPGVYHFVGPSFHHRKSEPAHED